MFGGLFCAFLLMAASSFSYREILQYSGKLADVDITTGIVTLEADKDVMVHVQVDQDVANALSNSLFHAAIYLAAP